MPRVKAVLHSNLNPNPIMPKTSRPERRKNDRFKREPKEYEETTISIDRVTRVVAGGRRMRFRAVVVVGNKKGKVGIGTGKANEVRSAVEKATAVAKRNMIRVPLVNGTIPHAVDTKYKAARIRLLPASEGTGVIAGSSIRVVLEHAGVKNVLSKRYGSSNKLVNAQAMMKAFKSLRGTPQDFEEEKGSKNVDEEEDSKETLKIQTISKKDIDKEGTLKVRKTDPKKDDKKKEEKPKK